MHDGESPSTTGAAASSSSVAARLRVQLACPTRPTRPQRRLRDLHSAAMTPNSPTKRARQALLCRGRVSWQGRTAVAMAAEEVEPQYRLTDSQLTHVLEDIDERLKSGASGRAAAAALLHPDGPCPSPGRARSTSALTAGSVWPGPASRLSSPQRLWRAKCQPLHSAWPASELLLAL